MDEVSGTKMIGDLPSSMIERVRSLMKDKVKNTQQIQTYKGADVYHLRDKGAGYVILAKDGEVLYFVRHESVRHNGMKPGRQVLVWRDSSSFRATGFAEYVFFRYLLPKYGVLICDQEQTQVGRAFWQYAIHAAFDRGLHVYFLDRRSSPNRLLEIEHDEDLDKYESLMWGSTEGHKRTFAVISMRPLTLEGRTT